MEPQTPPTMSPKPPRDIRSNVDTSRPFRSVKEAVAIFGERLLVGEIYCPKPYIYSPPRYQETTTTTTSWKYSPPANRSPEKEDAENMLQLQPPLLEALKKLEADLHETKAELKLLKERESETEIALASLNAELHKNMSKLAQAEAAAANQAATAAMRSTLTAFEAGKGEAIAREEERRRELMKRMENNSTLAQILSISSEQDEYFGGKRERKTVKKKPIVPLVGDWLFKKRGSPTTLHNPLYASPQNLY